MYIHNSNVTNNPLFDKCANCYVIKKYGYGWKLKLMHFGEGLIIM